MTVIIAAFILMSLECTKWLQVSEGEKQRFYWNLSPEQRTRWPENLLWELDQQRTFWRECNLIENEASKFPSCETWHLVAASENDLQGKEPRLSLFAFTTNVLKTLPLTVPRKQMVHLLLKIKTPGSPPRWWGKIVTVTKTLGSTNLNICLTLAQIFFHILPFFGDLTDC